MGSAAYVGNTAKRGGLAVGRVGGLAVALGVGTAIATGHGVAAAAPGDSSAGSSANDSPSSGADTKTDTKTGTAPRSTAGSGSATESETDDPDDKPDDKVGKKPRPSLRTAATKPAAARTAGKPAPSARSARTAAIEDAPEVAAPAEPVTAISEPVRAADPADTLATPDKVAVFVSPLALASSTVSQAQQRVAPITAAPPHPLTPVVKVVAKVLDWAAGAVPGSPAAPTLAWTLLAFARREVDNLLNRMDPSSAAATAGVGTDNTSLALAAAANPRPSFPRPGYQFSPSTSFVDWVTGNWAPNDTFNRYGIWGTDVGTMWDNGIPDDPATPINENQVLIAFGDTFGGPNMTGTWRLNTLFRSPDRDLSNGMAVPDGQWLNGNMFGGSPLWEEHYARQIILPERLPRGLPTGVTLIPTAGISVPTPGTQFGATQYLSFMSVKQWGAAGSWSTNYSAIAYSEDNGENWYIAPSSVRNNFGGNAKFQQAALVRPGDGFVYSYGTANGRQGQAYISRVAEADILNVTKYEYYSKGSKGGLFGIGAYKAGWYRNDPAKASPIFGKESGACGVGKPGNQVSEMSVQYNKTLGKYVAMHADQYNNIILRTSDTPEGAWSGPTVVMGQQGGGIYAPMMHPWSPSTLGTGTDLYFNLSVWNDYNVWLVKTDLTKL